MKYLLLSSLFLTQLTAMAQERATKLNLQPGQKITVRSVDTTLTTQKRGDQQTDMKTNTAAATVYEVLGNSEQGFRLSATLSKVKVDFDGFGTTMTFDSEDPKKQEGMMAENLKERIGKPDTMELDPQGKIIEKGLAEGGNGRGGGKGGGAGMGRGRGMMRAFNQQGSHIEHAFLLVPAEAGVGQGWKKDETKDGVKSQTIYFVDKINGTTAEISFKKKTKGTRAMQGGQQGPMSLDIDNLSSGNLTVDLRTGLVKTYREETETKTVMHMGEQDMPSTGKTVTQLVFE